MNNNPVNWICCAVAAALTAVQTNEIFQIVELILTCIAICVSVAYTVWKWYRKAKEDGKITEEEVDELMDEVKDIVDKEKKDD